MNPTEHGETFVLDSGLETDQDMGNYERFMGLTLPSENYMTTGSVYESVIHRERNLEYNGKCVQVVPHIPLEVIERIKKAAEKAKADIAIIEIGGTVGNMRTSFYGSDPLAETEASGGRHDGHGQLSADPARRRRDEDQPTQHAVRTLNGTGIQPDVIIARSETFLDKKRKEKIALFCNVRNAMSSARRTRSRSTRCR